MGLATFDSRLHRPLFTARGRSRYFLRSFGPTLTAYISETIRSVGEVSISPESTSQELLTAENCELIGPPNLGKLYGVTKFWSREADFFVLSELQAKKGNRKWFPIAGSIWATELKFGVDIHALEYHQNSYNIKHIIPKGGTTSG